MSITDDTTHRPWWKDVVCYQIWPKSFKDTTGNGHGDILGIIYKLDYLRGFGIDVIWVCPTYKSPDKDFGYDISDYNDINPMFGSLADMEQLIIEVHKRGMRILLDLVITHTSDQHPWFLESKSSKDNAKHDWYIWRDRRPGHTIANTVTGSRDLVEEPTNWKSCFGGSAWNVAPKRDQYYVHLFLAEEPDLNWENPETRQAVFDAAIGFWLDRGVDGFRIDTVNRISKDLTFPDAPTKLAGRLQPGSDFYINGPRSHFFLQEMRKYMDNHPRIKESGHDLMLVGELPRTPYDDVLRYTHPDSRELSMVFDFDMVKLGGHDNPDEVGPHEVKNLCDGHPSFTLPGFKFEVNKVQNLIANGAWGTVFMENHDQCRSVNRYATPNPAYYQRAAKLLCILQTTLSGTQFIFQGQEIGMQDLPMHWDYSDFRDPAALSFLRDMHALGPEAYENGRIGNLKFGRDNGRTPVQWNSGPNAGFSSCEEGATWIGVNDNKDQINLADQQKDPNSIWHFWKQQIQFRKKHREIFMHGAFEILDYDNNKSFTYLKTSAEDEVAIVCLNFSDEKQPLYLRDPSLTGQMLEFLVGNLGQPENDYMPLQAWEGRVYLVKPHAGASDGSRLTSLTVNAKSGDFLKDSTNLRYDSLDKTPLSAILSASRRLRDDGVPDVPLSAILEATKNIRRDDVTNEPLSAILQSSMNLRDSNEASTATSVLPNSVKGLEQRGGEDTLLQTILETANDGDDEPTLNTKPDAASSIHDEPSKNHA